MGGNNITPIIGIAFIIIPAIFVIVLMLTIAKRKRTARNKEFEARDEIARKQLARIQTKVI